MSAFLVSITAGALLLSSLLATGADWLEQFGLRKKTNAPAAGVTPGISALSEEQVVKGLKEALGKGIQHAVGQLGHSGGFLTNLSVKIPMPDKLRTVEKTLRTLQQDKLADEFVTTMNRAAEQAVPAAAGVFGDALQQLSVADAKAILSGPNDAATQYFRKTSQTNLFVKFLPVVKQATDEAGVTAAYKKLTQAASGGSAFGSITGSLLQREAPDLDGYVTEKAMDGLFKMMAVEEQQIRANPAARTTALLQRVFGSATK